MKLGEAVPTNENSAMHEPESLYERPEGRPAPGTLSAPWGERAYPNSSHNGTAVWEEFLKNGPALLRHAFDTYEPSRKTDKAFMDSYFSDKEYESRSPLLRKYAAAGHISSGETLSQQVKKLK